MVLHHCDNPNCVRIDHLFAGDAKANAIDMRTKGRWSDNTGERNGRAKLTRRDVSAIRKLYAAGGIKQATLADAYGVSPALISFIVTGKNWR